MRCARQPALALRFACTPPEFPLFLAFGLVV